MRVASSLPIVTSRTAVGTPSLPQPPAEPIAEAPVDKLPSLSFRTTIANYGTYANPILRGDNPDPGIRRLPYGYIMTTTGPNFPLRQSANLVDWELKGTVFAPGQEPKWVEKNLWAPEPAVNKHGQSIVVFNGSDYSNVQRIGLAVADKPEGPYRDIGKPLIAYGDMPLIDGHYFLDADGKQYIYWKEDGNAVGKPSRIMVQQLDESGTELVGEPVECIRNDRDWEWEIVEAPELEKRGEWYYMFYSGQLYATERYAEGVARAKSPLGPWEKAERPFLVNTDNAVGRGHASVVLDHHGQDYIVSAHWLPGEVNHPHPRVLSLQKLHFDELGWPFVKDETEAGGGSVPPPLAAPPEEWKLAG